MAFNKLQNIRAEIVGEYIRNLALTERVPADYFLKLAQKHVENKNYNEAALIIVKYKYFDHFDIMFLFENLVNTNRLPSAKLLINRDVELQKKAIHMLSTYKHHKVAAELLKFYKLNQEDFPELKTLIERSSGSYYIYRFLKPRDDSDYLPLYKIEELFQGNKQMIILLINCLLDNGMHLYAKGIYLRNQEAHSEEKFIRIMEDIDYDESKDCKY
mmetsp:Transcript_11934/g.8327  ORF Transcript_11934/g.8327 Transcript_11934/m.8327 type:complete len:215 (+) Transcript_11934:1464-2108(+)